MKSRSTSAALGSPSRDGSPIGPAQRDAAVEGGGDAEQVLRETGPVDLSVQDALERLLDGAGRDTGGTAHQVSWGAGPGPAEGPVAVGALDAEPASPTDSAALAFSGAMFPASSSERNRSTMPR